MGYSVDNVKNRVDHRNLEHFHEFLRDYAHIFTINLYATKDYTYRNLCSLIQIKDIVVLKGDKDSILVLMKK